MTRCKHTTRQKARVGKITETERWKSFRDMVQALRFWFWRRHRGHVHVGEHPPLSPVGASGSAFHLYCPGVRLRESPPQEASQGRFDSHVHFRKGREGKRTP